jgi:hypothetical protein
MAVITLDYFFYHWISQHQNIINTGARNVQFLRMQFSLHPIQFTYCQCFWDAIRVLIFTRKEASSICISRPVIVAVFTHSNAKLTIMFYLLLKFEVKIHGQYVVIIYKQICSNITYIIHKSLRWDIPVVLNQNYKIAGGQSKHNFIY